MACLVEANTGYISVNDNKDNNYLKRKLQNNISYTSQKTTVINDTLIRNICFGVDDKEINFDLYKKSIKIAELEDFEKEFNENSKK